MSFLDGLKKGAAVVGHMVWEQIQADFSKIQKMRADIDLYQEKYEPLSDKELLKKFKNSTGAQKIACGRLLKARGYGSKIKNDDGG